VEGHVALVPLAEIGARVLGPLVGLGEQHPAGEAVVDVTAELGEELVGLGEVLAVGPVLLVQVGDGVERRPSTPRRSQKSTARRTARRTAGLR